MEFTHRKIFGETWNKLATTGLPSPYTRFFKILIAPGPGNNNILYAAMWEGFFRSIDGGHTWNQVVPQGGQNLQCTDCAFIPRRTVYFCHWA